MTTLDFAHDPATTIRSLASIGIKSRRYDDIIILFNSITEIMTITHYSQQPAWRSGL